jgi:hypothetical protein
MFFGWFLARTKMVISHSPSLDFRLQKAYYSIQFDAMQTISNFFEQYAKALQNYDTKGLSYMYNIPCTMLSDDATSQFNDGGRLEGFFNQGAGFYKQFGIAHIRHEIWSRRELTRKIANVKVNWQFYDARDLAIYNCDYHYTLKLDKNNQWRIVLSVSVNEKERMEEWQIKAKNELVSRLG